MEILENIKKKYLLDLVLLLVLLLSFNFIAIFFVGHQGSPIIDCFSQNAYIPSEILKGKVLYKDIFATYGPFSYLFNALLFLVFGQHLNILYTVGLLNSVFILFSIYIITLLLSTRLLAFTLSVLVMMICVFHYYIFNFVFPYASAMSYAFGAFLYALLFCMLYYKHSRVEFALLSAFFLGLSFSNKLDFIFFGLVLASIIFYFRPLERKYIIYSLLAFISTPILCLIFLFFQGLNFNDIYQYLVYLASFIKSPTAKMFYANYTGLYPSIRIFSLDIKLFSYFVLILFSSFAVIYPLLLIISNKISFVKFHFPKYLRYILMLGLAYLGYILVNIFGVNDILFNWSAISATFILFFILSGYFINKLPLADKIKKFFPPHKELSLKDRLIIIVAFAAILSVSRTYYFVDIHSFGTFFIPMLLAVNLVFLFDYIPLYCGKIQGSQWRATLAITFLSLAFTFHAYYKDKLDNQITFPIASDRGIMFSVKPFSETLNYAIDYITANVPKNARILVIPQGTVLNFLTGRSSDNFYYDLLPPTIESFSEDKIVSDLAKNPPDYIILNNRDCSDWGFRYFGDDYGRKILSFIFENYIYQEEFGRDFIVKIYKRAK